MFELDPNVVVQIFLIFSTISIAIVTWIKMSESNKLLKTEIETRYRPTLARMHMGIPDNDIKQGTKLKKITFRIINNGTLPAVKVSKEYYVEIRENGIISNRKTSDSVNSNGIPMPSLAPNEAYGIDIDLDDLHNENAWTTNTCYFGLIVWYYDSRDKKYFYRIEGHLDHGLVMLSETTDMN